MANRWVLQWDKDDCAFAGLVKFDLLGLGMLTALRDCFALVAGHHGVHWAPSIPQEDPAVYEMLCAADTVGVFQVESRAQMATLPRLRPREFYDLVVEVALIRPGPIQGGSVHPYMHHSRATNRPTCRTSHASCARQDARRAFFPGTDDADRDRLRRSVLEADRLRQAMSSKRAPEQIEELRSRLLGGMAERGISLDVAEDIYEKILAFSSYGFPESHAISFAYLVYASAWLKYYYPAAFTAALLRAPPMGFYSPASLISDVRRRRSKCAASTSTPAADLVPSREAPAARAFTTRATLGDRRPQQPRPKSRGSGRRPAAAPYQPAIRVGLAEVRNLGQDAAAAIVSGEPYDRRRLCPAHRAGRAGAGGAGHCGRVRLLRPVPARSAVGGRGRRGDPARPVAWDGLACRAGADRMTPAEVTFADMWATGTYGAVHPIEHIRDLLAERGVLNAREVLDATNGIFVTVGGLVTHRQQPGTARGVVFLSLEDETGMANVICPPAVWQRHRKIGVNASALLISGRVERLDGAVSLLATSLRKLRVVAAARSRDFR